MKRNIVIFSAIIIFYNSNFASEKVTSLIAKPCTEIRSVISTAIKVKPCSEISLSKKSTEIPFWKQPIQKKDMAVPAQTKASDQNLKARVNDWMAGQKLLGFTENKGQMAGEDGKTAPYILFKAEVPNLNIWVTTTGLTYQFFNIEEKEEDREKKEGKQQQSSMKDEHLKSEWHRVDMVLKGANIKKENIVTLDDITQGDVNYYLGHCTDGIFKVKTHTKIVIKEVYVGIDWVLYTSSKGEGLKHDFIIHPNADAKQIKLIYEGSGELNIKDNQIHFKNEFGLVTEGQLLCYQGNEANVVTSNYTIKKNNALLYLGAGNLPLAHDAPSLKKAKRGIFSYEINIETENYNTNETLIIDPQLVWSTYHGGNVADGPMSIDCDVSGNVFVTGYTSSSNFPVQSWAGAYNQSLKAGVSASLDLFILRFTNTGSLTWATYYGGTGDDWGNYIKTDGANNVYITGWTTSSNFPVQSWGTYNQVLHGGGTWDAFILRFTNTGSLTWATYYGGSGSDQGNSVETDVAGNIYVCGQTNSANLPVQSWAGAYNQPTYGGGGFWGDAFILRFTNTGTLTWATYYGGSGGSPANSIETDGLGNIYVTGNTSAGFPTQSWTGAYNQVSYGGGSWDAFILRFTNTGALTWATYYGGSGMDVGNCIKTDGSGNIYATGHTTSANFPTQPWAGAYNVPVIGGTSDLFILRFTNAGSLTWATYYGGSSIIQRPFDNIEIDACENIYVVFETGPNTPTFGSTACGQYYDPTFNGSTNNIFICKFNNAGTLLWATYFGGDGYDFREAIALDNAGNLIVTGEWTGVITNASYPLVNPGGGAYYDGTWNGSDDIFVAKFIPNVPNYTQSQVNPSSCSCNGIATVSITCGEAPYSYSWSTGATVASTTLTTHSISSLCPGVYQVTVTSNCNIISVQSFTLTGAVSTLTANITTANASCSSPTGSVTINSVTSGVPNYTIAESTSTLAANINTPYTISPVTVGTHTYIITSSNGCSTTFTATILPGSTPPNISVISPVTLSCNPNTATLSASSTATGTPTYSWTGPGILSGAATASAVVNQAGNYTVTISQGACTNTAVVSVASNTNIPNISITQPATLTCLINSLVVTGTSITGGVTYSWSPQNVTTNTAVATSAGNYTLAVTNTLSGCVSTSVITVTQNTVVPDISITQPTTLTCLTTSVVLTGNSTTGGVTYSWSPQNVTTNTAVAISSGNYSLSVTNTVNGCTTASIVAVTQNTTVPNISTTVPVTLTCLTTSVVLTGASTTGGVTYSWSPQNVTTNTAIAISAGNYSLMATNSLNGCTSTTIVAVSQNTTVPNISATLPNTLTCLTTSVILNGNSTTTSGVTYSWSPQNVTTNTVVATNAGNYTLAVTNTLSSCTSITVVAVSQNTFVPNISITLPATLTCLTASVVLTGTSTTGGVTFSWSPQNVTTNTAVATSSGNYSFTVTNPLNGCTNNTIVTVVQNGAFPNISITQPTTLTCSTTSITLTGNSTTGGVTYSWSPQNVTTNTAVATIAGNYTFNVYDAANGCTSTSVIAVTQNTVTPTLTASFSNSLNCVNATATLTGISAGNSILWNGGALSNAANPAVASAAGNYSVTATNMVNGCITTSVISITQDTLTPNVTATSSGNLNCNTSSVNLTGSSTTSGVTYSWSPNVIGSAILPTATAGFGGTYTLIVTNPINGCTNSTTINLSSVLMFTANITVLNQINCNGANNGALQINNLGGGSVPFSITNLNNNNNIGSISSFPINLNGLAAGNYSIQVTDANGCSQILFASITQPSTLSASLNGNTTLCEGQSTTISSTVSGGTSPYAYQWSPTGGSASVLNASPTLNTSFTLTVTDNNGCQTTVPIQITVSPKPNASLVNNKLFGCAPVCSTFSITQGQVVGYSYSWSFTNSQTGSVTTSSLYDPEFCFNIPGSYNADLTITAPGGCSTTVTYNTIITVYAKPTADFSASPDKPSILEPEVNFTNLSTGATGYSWYNVNTLFSNQTNPTYVFQDPGVFLVTLIASNGQCFDTLSKIITIDDEFLFYIPDTFTPNDDGLNDWFYPVVSGYSNKNYSFMVFDRWGSQIFQTTQLRTAWDGFYKGEMCKEDVYVWKIKTTTNNGKSKEFTGRVTLLK